MSPVSRTLSVSDLNVHLGGGRSAAHILKNVSFDLAQGECLGVVGESGSGKSTLAKTLVGIHRTTGGSIELQGREVGEYTGVALRGLRRRVQMIPQNPYASLNPRRTIEATLAEALDPIRADVRRHRERSTALLEMVGLGPDALRRYPHEFSGGQRQRIAIMRAVAVEPELIIADEITSALDLTSQAEVLALFERLRHELDLTVIFITHNLAVVRLVSDRLLVLLHGEIIEIGDTAAIFADPRHPYTRRLLASIPGSPAFSLD